MKLSPALFATVLPMLCSCASQRLSSIHTYADLEAEMSRRTISYRCSQLTRHPQDHLWLSDDGVKVFFQLPFRERVFDIMDSFSKTELDGEYAENMMAMLLNKNEPRNWLAIPNPHPAEDIAYTNAIFDTIDSFTDAQVRNFCWSRENYERFEKNLKRWKAKCHYNPAPGHVGREGR